MALFAYFDNTVVSPSPVIGWYDNTTINYPTMPNTEQLLEVTAAQWSARYPDTLAWAVANASVSTITNTVTNTVTTVTTGEIIPYVRPVAPPTLAQQATTMLNNGLTITSSIPALCGIYAVDSATQSHIQAEIISIMLSGTFADGSSSVAWPDIAGTIHNFPVAQFKAFALAAGSYVAQLYKVINGSSTTLPSSSSAIS